MTLPFLNLFLIVQQRLKNMHLLSKLLTGTAIVSLTTIATILKVLNLMSSNLGTTPPTSEQLESENQANSPLFRALPHLKAKLAWRELGIFPTPIHEGSVKTKSNQTITFYVKREDLASSKYGGNKVRTLQHQLAVTEARVVNNDPSASSIFVAGSGGSNQVVATVVHAKRLSTTISMPNITPVWIQPDLPDLDNTLNMLSTLTMDNITGNASNSNHKQQHNTWGQGVSTITSLLHPLLTGNGIVLPPGGNNPAGVLGQIGGLLELAEQILNNEMPNPKRIYLPIGSSCTISGLILGVALVQQLHPNHPYLFKDLEIVGCVIHHGLAAGQRLMNVSTVWWAKYIPLTIRHTIHATAAELVQLGGPDLLQDSLTLIDNGTVRLIDDAALVGKYGGHSEISLNASKEYDVSGQITDVETREVQQPLWLCGHFASKAFAAMRREILKDIENRKDENEELPICLFWQTKSAIQPIGEKNNEWETFLKMPDVVKAWGDKGKSYSTKRQGVVDTSNVKSGQDGYRHLMKKINRPSKL